MKTLENIRLEIEITNRVIASMSDPSLCEAALLVGNVAFSDNYASFNFVSWPNSWEFEGTRVILCHDQNIFEAAVVNKS